MNELEALKAEIEVLRGQIDLAIELMHDQHDWLVAAFSALDVTIIHNGLPQPPRQGTVLRLIHGHKADRLPDKDGT